MSYSLTSVVEKILKENYCNDSNVEVTAGNSAVESGSDAHKRFVVFSYLRDFEFLWGLHQGGGLKETVEKVITASYRQKTRSAECIANELTMIVVWDGMPESDSSPMNVGGYVTPFDWAVMFSCCLFRAANDSLNKDKPKPKVRILILDLKSHEYGASFGVKAFQSLHGQFPWIQAYHPVGKQRLKSVAIMEGNEFAHSRAALPLDVFGFEHFVDDILCTDRVLSTFNEEDDADRQNDLEIAVGLWGNHLVKPGDRHTVANLIGPLILANGFSSQQQRGRVVRAITEDSPLRNALTQLAYATGLTSPVKGQGGGHAEIEILQAGMTGKLGRRNNLKFILIDDQYASGFHHILASLLYGNKYDPADTPTATDTTEEWNWNLLNCGGVKCYNNASVLLNNLYRLARITDWDMPRKLCLLDSGDILLLDLRLWLDDDQKYAVQKNEFFDLLKKVCDKLVVDVLRNEDESFDKAYRAAFENGVPNETAALVLLPLLLSHYDPSLPIVLFSSTHQRAVIEMVAHRPNIITDFAKPLLGNYAQIHEAEDILKDLRSALEKAIKLHEARIIWERIVNLISAAPLFYIQKVRNKSFFNRPFPSADIVINYPLQPEEIRKQLGSYFQHYILRAAYFDFVSIPWEFIEGGLTKIIVADYDRFDVTDTDHMRDFPKNGGGLLLKHLRHKKAHGNLTDLLSSIHLQHDDLRCFSILEFLVFIDFLEQAGHLVSSPFLHPERLDRAVSATVNGKLLPYALNLIGSIWGRGDSQSFSDTTKNVVVALRS